ncbi:MAG: amino acid adenylation domain-containing protein [Chloroflexi bacterium]|nr:amino acid adenylation domain-containing protein [Chloroflexota bacterium]
MTADLLSRPEVNTLPDLLRAAAEANPNQVIIHIAAAGHERVVCYRDLYTNAQQMATMLSSSGLAPGQVILIAVEASDDFLTSFWGAIMAGLIPAPLAAEPERILAIWTTLDHPALLINPSLGERLVALAAHPLTVAPLQRIAGLSTLPDIQLFNSVSQTTIYHNNQVSIETWHPQANAIAYLQFSSGSTGNPRGIELTHAALLANLRQMRAACAMNDQDSTVTWMPYYHDMGLITTHLLPLAVGIKQVKIAEFYFARRPLIWLELADRHRATLLTAAPFALELVARRVPAERIAALDLSCVRALVVGAEPIIPATCRAFLEHLAPAGLAPQALLPVYGLAEACVGVTLSPLGTGMHTYLLDRQLLVHEGRAVMVDHAQQDLSQPASPKAEPPLEIVDVGRVLPNCSLRIVDDRDDVLADGYIGQIQVAGPQLMRGYHRATDPTAAFADGWLRTGDLGFLLHGRLVITGRAKEIIIVNGQKYHAPDLEDRIRSIDGLQHSRLAVCGATRIGGAAERVVVFLALPRAIQRHNQNIWQAALPLLNEISRCLRRATNTSAIEIVPLATKQFPRTTSGKIRRSQLRARYEAGEFDSLINAVHADLAKLHLIPATLVPANLEQTIIQLCAQTLGIDPNIIGWQTSIFELGATSLQLMDLLALIGDQFQVEPDPAVLRAYETPAKLANWLRLQAQKVPEIQPRSISKNPLPAATEPIAVIGMACRLPDAETPEEFWANLIAGVDSIRPLPAARHNALQSELVWGSSIADIDCFDSAFFKISPAEAAVIDPQQRILLELAYQALEHAGYAGSRRLGRRVGVFIGVGESIYQQLLIPLIDSGSPLHPATVTGTMRNLIAGRIAHCLDLNGPAIAIDTACSSSLVALHLARTSLLAGDCDMAIVGGINLNLNNTAHQLLGLAGALSPSGRCRAFDAEADGIVLGEGAGIIILERQAIAQQHSDPILALIRGSAINNDGHGLSPMAPNPVRQAEVLEQAYHNAGIEPASVSYIEAHGTGTAIGDPIEARSLAQIFPLPPAGEARLIGSVKTNIGHLLNAAGIPSLIKVILMLQHGQIPPSLHYTTPNQRIALAASGLAINSTLTKWHGPQPLRAGINSFGFGGTNAHVILEAAPNANQSQAISTKHSFQLLALSARTQTALGQLAQALAKRLHSDQSLSLADVCFSMAEREMFEQRATILIDPTKEPRTELISALEQLATNQPNPAVTQTSTSGHHGKIALLFAGQGAQYPQQGAALYQEQTIFKTTLDAASVQLGLINGRTLLEWCFDSDVDSAMLADTAITQPLLVAFEVALARLVISWGLAPDAVVGHSVGELAAACIAGSLSFEAVLELARARGQLMATHAEPGMMAAVFAPAAVVQAVVAPMAADLSIAAFNTPNQVVIAGKTHTVTQALQRLEYDGYTAISINQQMAYHSPLIQAAAQPIAAAAAAFAPNPPSIPMLSSVNVDWLGGATTLDGTYWANQAIQPVQFAPAIERLINEGFTTFIEIGPGSTLAAFARQTLGQRTGHVEALLRRGENDHASIRTALSRLWVKGIDLDMAAIVASLAGGRRVALPAYPFARERHWLPTLATNPQPSAMSLHPKPAQIALYNNQQIAAVTLNPTPSGYSLQLKATDGQILLKLDDLQSEQTTPPPVPSTQSLLHAIVWNEVALPSQTTTINTWLIISPMAQELATKLASAINALGQQCMIINNDSLASEQPTFADQPYGVIFLADCGPLPTITHADQLDQGVLQLLQATQAMLTWPEQPAGLWVVTAGAYTPSTDEDVAAERALVAGLGAAIPDQNPGFPCVVIDLPWADTAVEQTKTLVQELGVQPISGVFAWRDGKRLSRSIAPLPAGLPSHNLLTPAEPVGRVIVIVGGAGGVGALLARHLATHNRPKLILLGRSAINPQRAGLLAELEALGAEADYHQVDICDAQQVEALIAKLTTNARIFGIIHAAATIDVGSLSAKQPEQFTAVLAPKVKGTWLLARTLERYGQQPAFFITCSSIAAVIAGIGGGIADYVAANAFLDAFATSERWAGRTMLALNWAAWDGIGLAAMPLVTNRLQQRGLPPLQPNHALQAFEQALNSQHSQLVVLAPHSNAPATELRTSLPAASIEQPSLTKLPNISSPIAQQLQSLIGKALRIDPASISPDASFLSLGLDSLQAVDLVKQLEQSSGRVLPLTLFFEFQTIRALAEHLDTTDWPQTASAPTAATTGASTENSFALAPSQLAFYLGNQLYPEMPTFSFVRQDIAGPLDQTALQAALGYLVERHSLLRCQFEPIDQQQTTPRQQIIPADQLPIALWFEQHEASTDLESLEAGLINYAFDLHQAPLFRVVLYRQTENCWVLFWLLHHSIADGWSMQILLTELWQVYTQQTQGQPAKLQAIACQFNQYVSQTLHNNTSAQADHDRAWWKTQIQHHRAALAWTLPDDRIEAKPSQPVISSIRQQVDRETSIGLRHYAAALGVSLFHLLLATYARQLANWSQANAMSINVAEHGRDIKLAGIEAMVGCCADQIPLLLQMGSAETSTTLASVVRDQWAAIQQHRTISARDVAGLFKLHSNELHASGAASFSLARFSGELPNDCPITIHDLVARTATPSTRLSLLIWEFNQTLQCMWTYQTNAFQAQTIANLADGYQQELTAMVQSIHVDITTLDAPNPQLSPIELVLTPQRILNQCLGQPAQIAVRAGGASLTYGALADAAHQVANWLKLHSTQPNQSVGLLTQPSIASIVGMVGALWAGVAWIGLNPDYPSQKLQHQLQQAEAQLLLYHEDTRLLAEQLQHNATATLTSSCLDRLIQSSPLIQPAQSRVLRTEADATAYIMFTSGSTGTPKGVPISQRSLASYLQWLTETFDYSPNDRLLLTAALSFDAAISQILGPLTSGGTVIVLEPLVIRDPNALLAAIEQERPTIWRSVPALWERLISSIEQQIAEGQPAPALTELRLIGVGGEALPASYVRRWMDIYGERQQIVNHYGPTEATINAVCYRIPSRPSDTELQIPIGQPISGVITRVLDAQGQTCRPLEIGELYLGGLGLSPGYLGQPDLTAIQFVPDPLGTGERLYRTGDLVRELSDGNLVFMGRADHQISLNGYRIEPLEIEAALLEHPSITRCVVWLEAEDQPAPMLVVYLESSAELPATTILRRWLRSLLPEFMIPQRFYRVPRLPTTSSGKIDRSRLQLLPRIEPTLINHGNLPTTPTEQLLAEIWQNVLQLPVVQREDDFFDLGGDSLRLLQVLSQLKGRVSNLPRAAMLYQQRTLAACARIIDAEAASQNSQIPKPKLAAHNGDQPKPVNFGLTSIQKGFLLAEALDPSAATTWCASLVVNGPLELNCLRQAFEALVNRHLMLRVRIDSQARPPSQREEPNHRPQLSFDDLSDELAAGIDEQHVLTTYWQAAQARRFNLEHDPLLQMQVLRLSPTRHIWLISGHHIIGDGWSTWIFGQELLWLYDSFGRGEIAALPVLRSTFNDYVNLLQQQPNLLSANAEYWRNTFAPPYHRPILSASRQAAAKSAGFLKEIRTLPASRVEQLRQIATSVGLTPYLVLLTIFVQQLRRLSGVDDLVVGTAHAGRDLDLPDIERIFGCFATALPIRISHPSYDRSLVHDLLQPVAQAFRAAYLHALPPSEITRILASTTNPQASELSAITATGAQFFFTFLDFDALGKLTSQTLTLDWQASETEINPPLGATEILLAVRVVNNTLQFTLQAAADTLEQHKLHAMIEQMLADLASLALATSPSPIRFSSANQASGTLLPSTLDAALIGYLPSSSSLAKMVGLQGASTMVREQLRRLLFPQGQPRWVEVLQTPIGASAMLCLPWFAEELHSENAPQLEAEIAKGMLLAQTQGVRCVSLAGMLPALSGYGFGVLRLLAGNNQATPALTTGHATTVVAVIQTIEAALKATGRLLEGCTMAFVGLGSIGQAVLQVLLKTLPHPRSLILCDTTGHVPRLKALAQSLAQDLGYQGTIRVMASEGKVPAAIYQAQVIVAATSSPEIIDVERLQARTIVIDDSFPACLDTGAAIQRMQRAGDVLIVGGGQLACGPSLRTIDLPIDNPGLRQRIMAEVIPDSAASCQLEALLWAADPNLPLTHGLVSADAALRYRQAAIQAGFRSAPLHVQGFQPDLKMLAAWHDEPAK